MPTKCELAIPASLIRELFDYSAETGELRWRIPVGKQSKKALGSTSEPYRRVNIFRRHMTIHRIAWAHVFGKWPDGEIDHIDGNGHNNRISNLRDVSTTVNQQNQKRARRDNQTGLLGVSVCKGYVKKKWRVDIRHGGKQHYVGRFESPESAHAAYLDKKRALHEGCTI